MRASSLAPILALALASPAAAQILDDPRGLGMGGALRGDPVGNSAIIYNPAGMSRAYMYSISAAYFRSGADTNMVSLNIVDSKTQPALAMGLAYGFEFGDSNASEDFLGHDVRLAMSAPLAQNIFNLGVGLNYVNYTRPGEDLEGFTIDLGFLWSLSPSVHIAGVGENLIDMDDPAWPRRAGGGLAYTGGIISADVDALADFSSGEETKPVFMAGIEVLVGETVPLRGGVEINQATGTNWATGGLGFVTGKGAQGTQFNLAHRQSLDRGDDFVFSAGLSFFL